MNLVNVASVKESMRIVYCKIYLLEIPFHEAFSHSLKSRDCSDSIIFEISSDDGFVGYGEGITRPYVTGENRELCIENLRDKIGPRLKKIEFDTFNPTQLLEMIAGLLPKEICQASRTAAELALIDLLLKRQKLGLASILPAIRENVVYSGVISSGNLESLSGLAERFKTLDLNYIKIKLTGQNDYERVKRVRQIMGPSVSIRVDANGVFSVDEALSLSKKISELNVESFEQPLAKEDLAGFIKLNSESAIAVMVDESVVTLADAIELVNLKACDAFNLRVAKCGGIYKTLQRIEFARSHNITVQLGCFVGETALLSVVGRQLAATVQNIKFVEGSYSTLLLKEDICEEDIVWKQGGKAQLLKAEGLGVTINRRLLEKYSTEIIDV